jgi:hypothetical protein
MNYQIILDEEEFRHFIDWLPDLEDNEKFYCSLFARKKYDPELIKSNDKAQLRRFLSNKEQLYDRVKQLEVPLGAYRLKDRIAPQASLVLYINPNPRNLIRASYDGIIKLTEMLKYQNQNFDPLAEMMSCVQSSQSRKLLVDFDIDDKNFDLSQLAKYINLDAVDVLETRGGYHLLIHLARVAAEYQKTFYRSISNLEVDQTGDQLLPVAGCTQGGFMPRFLDWDKAVG